MAYVDTSRNPKKDLDPPGIMKWGETGTNQGSEGGSQVYLHLWADQLSVIFRFQPRWSPFLGWDWQWGQSNSLSNTCSFSWYEKPISLMHNQHGTGGDLSCVCVCRALPGPTGEAAVGEVHSSKIGTSQWWAPKVWLPWRRQSLSHGVNLQWKKEGEINLQKYRPRINTWG